MAELERCLALTQVSVTTTSVVSESASEYSPKS
jgi:hypothetical protein